MYGAAQSAQYGDSHPRSYQQGGWKHGATDPRLYPYSLDAERVAIAMQGICGSIIAFSRLKFRNTFQV